MLKCNLTSKGIDLILALAKMQDETGLVRGVYYQDICSELGISIQAYYDLLAQLYGSGMLCWVKTSRCDRDVQLVKNDFSYPGAFQEGYINIARPFLFTRAFRRLKAKAKLLVLDILRIVEASKIKCFKIGRKEFLRRYQELMRVSARSLMVYVGQIHLYISVCLKAGIYYFTPVKDTQKRLVESENQRCYKQIVIAGCRRNRIDITKVAGSMELLSVCKLFDTYKYHVNEKIRTIADYILMAIQSSVELYNAAVSTKKEWNYVLNPQFIHKLLRDGLIRDKQI